MPRRFITFSAQPCVSRELGRGGQIVHTLRLGAFKAVRRDGVFAWSLSDGVFDSTEQLLSLIDKYTTRRETTWIMVNRLAYQWVLSGLGIAGLGGKLAVKGYNFSHRVATALVSINGKRCNLVDTENYLDKDLAWIAIALGSSIPEPPLDTDTDSAALDKARLECQAVADMIMALSEMAGCEMEGAWGWSLGSLAWHSYRSGLMQDDIYIHADKEATALERAAYIGGRNECRFIGKRTDAIHVVDYNSLYAHVMATEPMPCKLIGVHGETVDSLERGLANGLLAIASVTVDAKINDYPCLLWPGKTGPRDSPSPLPAYCAPATQWRRVWSRGVFDCTLGTAELRRCMESGELRAVSSVAWYECGILFRRFVDWWYARRVEYRQKGQTFKEAVAKRILTVIPGKFGQHARDWQPAPNVQCRNMTGHWWAWDSDSGDWRVYRALNGCAQVYGVPGEWRHSAPAISGHITSAARVLTDTAVRIAGDFDCYYYDTDALHVTNLGLDRLRQAGLLHDIELGKLKLKGSYNGGEYRNARDFTLGASGPSDRLGRSDASAERIRQTRNASERATDCCAGIDNQGQNQSALCAGSDINNLFRPGSDAWRSSLAVSTLKRFRYSGRVNNLGWVQPRWMSPGNSGELFARKG